MEDNVILFVSKAQKERRELYRKIVESVAHIGDVPKEKAAEPLPKPPSRCEIYRRILQSVEHLS